MEPKRLSTAAAVLLTVGGMVLLLAVVGGWALASNFDNLGNLVKVVTYMRSQGTYPASTKQLVEGAMQGMVESLHDPYSVYMDPTTFKQFQEQIQGAFGGLGMMVTIDKKTGYLIVVNTIAGTPAQRGGLSAHDTILKIGDSDTKGMSLDKAVSLLRGPVGSSVTLTIALPNGQQRSVSLVREEIDVPTVQGNMVQGAPGIGYVRIYQFSDDTPQEMKAVLTSLMSKGLEGLILDLRDNPGGELQSAVNVARFFLPKGSPVVYIDSKHSQDVLTQTEPRLLKVPVVVLVNGNTASAAEILSGAIKDTGVGILVGTRTFGKGVVQTVYRLAGGAGLKLTTARYLTSGKHDIEHKGIAPNRIVTNPESGKPDRQYEAALTILRQEVHANAA